MRRTLGRPPVKGVDQHDFLDAGELVEQFAHRQVQAGLFGRGGV
jgi:hypothetical protein